MEVQSVRGDVEQRHLPGRCVAARQGTGQFHLQAGKEVLALSSRPPLIRTELLPEEQILELARQVR